MAASGKIESIVVKVRQGILIRDAKLLGIGHFNFLRIAWVTEKAPLYPTTLRTSEWIPVCINFLYEHGGTRIRYFHTTTPAFAWEEIRRSLSLKLREDEKPVEIKLFHTTITEIEKKYNDPCSATFIYPESWLDKKLQEVYYSGRSSLKKVD